MRKPRDLAKYTDKAGAIEFLKAMLEQAESEPEGLLLRIKVEYKRWHPDWSKK